MKVIILTDSKLTEQHLKDLYVEQILKEFDVEIWDISYFMLDEKDDKSNVCSELKIKSFEEFDLCLKGKKEEKTIILSKINPYQYKKIYSIVKKYDIELICLDKEVIGEYWIKIAISDFGEIRTFESLIRKIKAKLLVNNVSRSIINRIIRKIPQYDYFCTSYLVYKELAKTWIPMHHIKYDEYFMMEDERLVAEKYALFVDTAAVLHPQYKGQYTEKEINSYYQFLRLYFDRFEIRTGLQIVIAGYPKVVLNDSFYGDRKVIYYKTPQLIKYAEIVLTHFTTSIITVLLARKPLLFLDSLVIRKNRAGRSVHECTLEFAKQLHAPVDVIEDLDNLTDWKTDNKAYDKFIYKYVICKDKQNKTNGEIICEFLNCHKNFIQK